MLGLVGLASACQAGSALQSEQCSRSTTSAKCSVCSLTVLAVKNLSLCHVPAFKYSGPCVDEFTVSANTLLFLSCSNQRGWITSLNVPVNSTRQCRGYVAQSAQCLQVHLKPLHLALKICTDPVRSHLATASGSQPCVVVPQRSCEQSSAPRVGK
jgi:hypothetical protein